MSEFTHFAPRKPEGFTVVGGQQTKLADRPSSVMCASMYITNNSDVPVYLGFTSVSAITGNAQPNYGITVFPKSVFVFDDPIPTGCAIWATCDEGSEALVGVQQ